MRAQDVRRIALALPGAEEYEHGGLPAFRIHGGRRFATMLDDSGVNLFLGEEAILEGAELWPDWSHVRHWGKRVAALRVLLPKAPAGVVEDLIEDSWRRVAPAALVRER